MTNQEEVTILIAIGVLGLTGAVRACTGKEISVDVESPLLCDADVNIDAAPFVVGREQFLVLFPKLKTTRCLTKVNGDDIFVEVEVLLLPKINFFLI